MSKTRREQLLAIMKDAVAETRKRIPTLRGPFIISDADLDRAYSLADES